MDANEIVRMELKYCECCGGLLLRMAGNGAVYCSGCTPQMRTMAVPRAREERRGRKRKAITNEAPPAATTVDIDAVAVDEPELPPPFPPAREGWSATATWRSA